MRAILDSILLNWNEPAFVDGNRTINYFHIANTLSKYLFIFDKLELNSTDTVLIASNSKVNKSIAALACLVKGVNFCILPSHLDPEDALFYIQTLGKCVGFVDSSVDNSLLNSVHVFHWFDISNFRPISHPYYTVNTANIINVDNLSISKDEFYELTQLVPFITSYMFTIHIGITEISKVSTMSSKAIFTALLKYNALFNVSKPITLGFEDINTPYQFIGTVLYTLQNGGYVVFSNIPEQIIESKRIKNINHLFINGENLNSVLDTMYKNTFLRFLFGIHFFFKFRNLKIINTYGRINSSLKTLLNKLFVKVRIGYVLTEDAYFVSYKDYNLNNVHVKLKGNLSLGHPTTNVIVNQRVGQVGDIRIVSDTLFREYIYPTYIRQSVFVMGLNKIYKAEDIGTIVNGELMIYGTYLNVFVNENGLVIPTEHIVDKICEFKEISDALLISVNNQLILFVELDIENSKVYKNNLKGIAKKNLVFKEKINKKLDNYCKIDRIVIYPGKFPRRQGRVLLKNIYSIAKS